MKKRGVKPKGKVNIKWSANFAYAIGLLVSDGSLSIDGRHINFTSNDLDQIVNFKKCLGLNNKAGRKSSGTSRNLAYQVQFGDVLFYKFLLSIGLMPNKSKVIGVVKVPDKYFFDFLRGSFDGDGCTYSYWDKRWKSSFMYYLAFVSASKEHILWLQETVERLMGARGHTTNGGKKVCYQLKYAKKEAKKIFDKMYYSDNVLHLSRKKLKIKKTLAILGEQLKFN